MALLTKVSSTVLLIFIFILPLAMDPIGSVSAANVPRFFFILIAVALLLTLNLSGVKHLIIVKAPKS